MSEARTFLQQDLPEPEMIQLDCGSVGVFTTRCPGSSAANEDAVACIPIGNTGAVLVVADGMGGGASGEQASGAAIASVVASVTQFRSGDSPRLRTAILNGIEQANRDIQAAGIGAATTLAVLEIDGRQVRPYHVGDCLIMIVGNRGKKKLETVAHSPVGYGVEAGLIHEDDALLHEQRHLVLNVVGDPQMRIEIGPTVGLAPRDTVLLASDGLADNLEPGEIAQRIRKGRLPLVANRLARETMQRMNQQRHNRPCNPDDVTFVLYRPAVG